jgi:Transglutaminase-like superfamily
VTARERMLRLARSIIAAACLGIRDPGSLWLSMRMTAWIILISIVARLVSLSTMYRLAETRRRWPHPAILPPEEIARRIDRVFHAGLVSDGSCWKRAAILRRYLQLDGIETDVVFGVMKTDSGRLAGHAWLERDGIPFLEREPTQPYAVTFRHPSR